MLVKRVWKKEQLLTQYNEMVDIWDSGSHRYERWPDGQEFYWEIISRDQNPHGFSEILRKKPRWQAPGAVMYQDKIPLCISSDSEFQMGAWSVRQSDYNISSAPLTPRSPVNLAQKNSQVSQAHSSAHKTPKMYQKLHRGQKPDGA
jgi:hypothetical protein